MEWDCRLQRVNYDCHTETFTAPGSTLESKEGGRLVKLRGPGHDLGRRSLVGALLRHAASSSSVGSDVDARRDTFDERQLRHMLKAGLAPLLWRWARDTGRALPPVWHETLMAADLTAQVVGGSIRDATLDVVDACREAGVRVTLLKGVSIGDEHYPAAHLRTMGDVDLLVAECDGARVRRMLQRRGYARMAGFHEREDFHGAPLFQPEFRVWVEIHTGLFPEADRLRRNRLFAPSHLQNRIVASTFHGRPVGRLGAELQLVYIASYWMRDACNYGLHASFVRPLLDAVYLLEGRGPELEWDVMLEWLDNDVAAASLYVLLAFLTRRGLAAVPDRIFARLASMQVRVGRIEHRILDAMIDRSLLQGRPFLGSFGERHPMIEEAVLRGLLDRGSPARKLLSLPWALVFPPWEPARYAPAYHRARLLRLLAGRN